MRPAPAVIDLALCSRDDRPTWVLTLSFALGRGLLSDQLRLGLDRSLRAVPAPADLDRKVTLNSVGSASIAHVKPGIRVSENRRVVQIDVPRRPFGLRGLAVELEVEWVNPVHRPSALDFDARFSYLGFSVNHQTLRLLNLEPSRGLSANLLNVLAEDDRRFYFPRQPALIPMSYEDFSPLTGRIQSLPRATVWGTMWPTELSFWHSSEGAGFLVRQLVQYEVGGARARRIAVLPDDPAITPAMRLAYLAELEVHHRHEVDVRLMDAAELRKELGGESDALLCVGAYLGVYYRGIERPVSNATAGLLISPDGIHSMRDVYDEVQARGSRWDRSRLRTEVLSSAIARRYITHRVRMLRRVTPELASLPQALEG